MLLGSSEAREMVRHRRHRKSKNQILLPPASSNPVTLTSSSEAQTNRQENAEPMAENDPTPSGSTSPLQEQCNFPVSTELMLHTHSVPGGSTSDSISVLQVNDNHSVDDSRECVAGQTNPRDLRSGDESVPEKALQRDTVHGSQKNGKQTTHHQQPTTSRQAIESSPTIRETVNQMSRTAKTTKSSKNSCIGSYEGKSEAKSVEKTASAGTIGKRQQKTAHEAKEKTGAKPKEKIVQVPKEDFVNVPKEKSQQMGAEGSSTRSTTTKEIAPKTQGASSQRQQSKTLVKKAELTRQDTALSQNKTGATKRKEESRRGTSSGQQSTRAKLPSARRNVHSGLQGAPETSGTPCSRAGSHQHRQSMASASAARARTQVPLKNKPLSSSGAAESTKTRSSRPQQPNATNAQESSIRNRSNPAASTGAIKKDPAYLAPPRHRSSKSFSRGNRAVENRQRVVQAFFAQRPPSAQSSSSRGTKSVTFAPSPSRSSSSHPPPPPAPVTPSNTASALLSPSNSPPIVGREEDADANVVIRTPRGTSLRLLTSRSSESPNVPNPSAPPPSPLRVPRVRFAISHDRQVFSRPSDDIEEIDDDVFGYSDMRRGARGPFGSRSYAGPPMPPMARGSSFPLRLSANRGGRDRGVLGSWVPNRYSGMSSLSSFSSLPPPEEPEFVDLSMYEGPPSIFYDPFPIDMDPPRNRLRPTRRDSPVSDSSSSTNGNTGTAAARAATGRSGGRSGSRAGARAAAASATSNACLAPPSPSAAIPCARRLEERPGCPEDVLRWELRAARRATVATAHRLGESCRPKRGVQYREAEIRVVDLPLSRRPAPPTPEQHEVRRRPSSGSSIDSDWSAGSAYEDAPSRVGPPDDYTSKKYRRRLRSQTRLAHEAAQVRWPHFASASPSPSTDSDDFVIPSGSDTPSYSSSDSEERSLRRGVQSFGNGSYLTREPPQGAFSNAQAQTLSRSRPVDQQPPSDDGWWPCDFLLHAFDFDKLLNDD